MEEPPHDPMLDATNPRVPGGDIAGGTGDPHARNDVVIDASKAVLLDAVDVAVVEPYRQGVAGSLSIALLLQGRINKTQERVRILFLLNEDGAAGLITQLIGVAYRAGLGDAFMRRIRERWEEMPT